MKIADDKNLLIVNAATIKSEKMSIDEQNKELKLQNAHLENNKDDIKKENADYEKAYTGLSS